MNKIFSKTIVIVILIIFITSYLISESGYYEYTVQQRTIITNEKIKEFEQDIKDNKDIDLIDYLDKGELDYSNAFTNLVYRISDNSNKLAKKAMKYLFKKIGSLIED